MHDRHSSEVPANGDDEEMEDEGEEMTHPVATGEEEEEEEPEPEAEKENQMQNGQDAADMWDEGLLPEDGEDDDDDEIGYGAL